MVNLLALLTITPIGNGKKLTYFWEYKAGDVEVGWANDGKEVAALTGQFEILAKSQGRELIVKTLPIQTTTVIEVVAESSVICDPETGEIIPTDPP
jgi:hypothetical protein